MRTELLGLSLPSGSLVLGWVFFGAVATIALGYAKWKEEWIPAILGIALMIYPLFFPSGAVFWILGTVLTLLLFVPRRFLGG